MAAYGNQALIATTFRHLIAATKVDAALDRIHTLDDLIKHFDALPWDEKVFPVADEHGISWAAEVHKDGPTLILTPTRPDVTNGVVRVCNSSFWKQVVEAIETAHPGHQVRRPETFFERLFHDHVGDPRLKQLADARREDEAVRDHRLKMREMQNNRTKQWRNTKADENRYMYWLWYQ